MRVLIVEDEKLAREHLQEMILDLEPGVHIAGQCDSVESAVHWLHNNACDLIFLDIHLADDLSFKIFDQVQVQTPIIFTTAYDQYAIKAFKVNSVDYLLKPIDREELREALVKFHRFNRMENATIAALKESFANKNNKTYQSRFMVKKGERIGSIKLEDIAYFEGEDRYVTLVNRKGEKYFVDYKLSDLEELLDPNIFFRFNRSFIGHFDAIESIISFSKSRVKVNLNPATKRDVIVSTENTRMFKAWLNR